MESWSYTLSYKKVRRTNKRIFLWQKVEKEKEKDLTLVKFILEMEEYTLTEI